MAPTLKSDHLADWVLMTDRVYLKTLSAFLPWMVILRSLWLQDQIAPQLILCNWPIANSAWSALLFHKHGAYLKFGITISGSNAADFTNWIEDR